MADAMNRAGGMPGQPPDTAMERARSPLNPADMVMMKNQGKISGEMTIGQYLENAYGIKWETPAAEAAQIMTQKVKQATPMGKAQAMSGQGAPQQPTPQQAEPSGMDGLLRRLGG